MIPLQLAIERWLAGLTPVAGMLEVWWAWPLAESAHFIGLTLLFGSIAAWDLRLLGVARDVPVEAFHRLVPCAAAGFVIDLFTGSLFLVTFPDQYVYNAAFHVKLLCLMLAGANVVVFYLTTFQRVRAIGPGTQLPFSARLAGATSLLLWVGVIVCGRMITVFRPVGCGPDDVAGVIATCVVRSPVL
jgi:hypothetical protein